MAKLWWFASPLTNAQGAWFGRFLRPDDLVSANPSAVAVLREWFAGTEAAGGELILPASGNLPGWQAREFDPIDDITVVATGGCIVHLDTARDPDWTFSRSGADLADTGWLLNRPVDVDRSGKRRSPVQLLKLLAEIERDAETHELEKAFRADPELSYQLLRLLNSAAFGMRTRVKSIGHAITLLGRRQLQRWLQLLIYAQPGKGVNQPNPLLQLAAYRGSLLEELARQARASPDDADSAYMVGIFSLLDRLVAQPMSQIVRELPVTVPVAEALSKGDGPLGHWLGLALASERGDLESASGLLDRWGVSPADWLRIQNTAFRWAYGLGIGGEAS